MAEKFRFQNQRALLTYKTQIPKDSVKAFFTALGVTKVFIAHETGHEETPYLHTHICVEWPKAYQTRNARRFDIEDIHPNIKALKTAKDFQRALGYLSKEDPENEGLGDGMGESIVDKIWSQKSLGDALQLCTNHNQIIPTIAAWKVKPIASETVAAPMKWYGYQLDIIAIIHSPKAERKIHWFYETVGGIGKTFTGKWCAQEYGTYVVDCFGGTANLATIIQNALQGGWSSESIIFDFPRKAQQHEIYEGIECVCNGRITVTKYNSTVVNFKPPRLIVFANFPPQWGSMSADRWDCWEITQDGNLEPRGPRNEAL